MPCVKWSRHFGNAVAVRAWVSPVIWKLKMQSDKSPNHTGIPRLFVLSAILTKQDGSNVSISSALGYRVALDGEDAVVGRYVQHVMDTNPGFALACKVNVMEITREDLAHMECANNG